MPFKSDKQRKFFNVASNRARLEAEGVDVDEWNQSSKGLKLPETAPKPRKKKAAGPVVPSRAISPRVEGQFYRGLSAQPGIPGAGGLVRGLLAGSRPEALSDIHSSAANEALRLAGPGKMPAVQESLRDSTKKIVPVMNNLQKRLSNPQLPPPPHKVVGPIQKYGQLLDMDRDDLLEKLAHMELRNRFVQRTKEALKLPDSMSGAMSALGGAGGAVDPSLLSRAIPNLTGAAGGAISPSLISKLKTMVQPYADPALKWLNENPTAALGLGGAAGGAALGGLSSLAGPRKKKRVLSNMLTGGLAGGALGLGGGALAQGLGLGTTFSGMKDNVMKAMTPEPKAVPQNPLQEDYQKADTVDKLESLAEGVKPVNNPTAAGAGVVLDTLGAGAGALQQAHNAHPLASSLGLAHVGTGLKKEWERKQINRGDVDVGHRPGAFPLNDPRYGVSVNALDDSIRGLEKILKSEKPMAELERLFPDIVAQLPKDSSEAMLKQTATEMLERMRATRNQRTAAAPPAPWAFVRTNPPLQRHATGAQQLEHAFQEPIRIQFPEDRPGPNPGPTRVPPNGQLAANTPPGQLQGLVHQMDEWIPPQAPPAPPRYVTVTPQMQETAAARTAIRNAPTMAYDFFGDLARYFPRTNNAFRHTSKYIPFIGAGLAGLSEHQRIAAENAARAARAGEGQ